MENQLILQKLSKTLGASNCFQNIFMSKIIIFKIFWFGLFILGSVATVFYINQTVSDYFQFTVVTRIQTKYQQPTPFPAISFCPMPNQSNMVPFTNKSDLKLYKTFCSFNHDLDCDRNFDNYFQSFKTWYGLCFRFNSGKNMSGHSIPILNSTIGGRDDSLKIKFNSKYPAEFFVWIHDPSSPPDFERHYNHEGNFNLIKSSEYNYLGIQRTVEEKLGLPYNDCFKDLNQFPLNKEIINHLKKNNRSYKQTDCLKRCFEVHYLKDNKCNCTNTSLGHVWKDCWTIKENQTQESCTWNYKANFFKKSIINKCKKYCPLECDSTHYFVSQKSVSTEFRPYESYFFFESLEYTLITQIPKFEPYDLISDIGGHLSLFLGLSFISFFEIIQIISEYFYVLFQKDNHHKSIKDTNRSCSTGKVDKNENDETNFHRVQHIPIQNLDIKMQNEKNQNEPEQLMNFKVQHLDSKFYDLDSRINQLETMLEKMSRM